VKVRLNGDQVDLAPGATVAAAVAVLDAQATRGVAVAVDGEVVPRSAWEATALEDGQEVEVLHAVQGG
jgi:sulfur carrier protein